MASVRWRPGWHNALRGSSEGQSDGSKNERMSAHGITKTVCLLQVVSSTPTLLCWRLPNSICRHAEDPIYPNPTDSIPVEDGRRDETLGRLYLQPEKVINQTSWREPRPCTCQQSQ